MPRLNVDRSSLVTLEVYTRLLFVVLSDYQNGKALSASERRHLREGRELLDRVSMALGQPVTPRISTARGVDRTPNDEVDATFFFALKAWRLAQRTTDVDSLNSRLSTYRETLDELARPSASPSQPVVEEMRQFFRHYNQTLALYAAV